MPISLMVSGRGTLTVKSPFVTVPLRPRNFSMAAVSIAGAGAALAADAFPTGVALAPSA